MATEISEQEKIHAFIDEEIQLVETMTPEEFAKHIENMGEYDPMWDVLFEMWGIGKNND